MYRMLIYLCSHRGAVVMVWTGMATAQQYQNCEICKKERAEFQKKREKVKKSDRWEHYNDINQQPPRLPQIHGVPNLPAKNERPRRRRGPPLVRTEVHPSMV